MGQHHLLVNLDQREYVAPAELGLGAKQREHTGAFRGTLCDAQYLLTCASPARGGGDWPATDISGAWAGDRVVIVGDYTQDGDISGWAHAGTLYSEVLGAYTDISSDVRDAFAIVFNMEWDSHTYGKADQQYTTWTGNDPHHFDELNAYAQHISQLPKQALHVWAGLVTGGMSAVDALKAAPDALTPTSSGNTSVPVASSETR